MGSIPAAGGTRIMREPRDTCARNEREGHRTGQMGRCNRCVCLAARVFDISLLMRSKAIFSTAC